MGRRIAAAIAGAFAGGAVGWVIAQLTGWGFAIIIGIIAGGIGLVILAESRRSIPTVEELQTPQPISLSDPEQKP